MQHVNVISLPKWSASMAPPNRREVGESLFHHDVHQFARDVDLLHDLLACNGGGHFFIPERAGENEFFGRIGGHDNAAAQLAIDLHRNLDLFFLGEHGVVLWPWSLQQISLFTEHFPEFVCQIGSEGVQQEYKVTLHHGQKRRGDCVLSNRFFSAVQYVHQLHDGRDTGVEMPASLEVVADAFDGLVQLALDGTCCGRQLRGYRSAPIRMTGLRVAHDTTIDPPEESLDALDAGVLPIEVAFRGSREQHVETCADGAVAGDHFIRPPL